MVVTPWNGSAGTHHHQQQAHDVVADADELVCLLSVLRHARPFAYLPNGRKGRATMHVPSCRHILSGSSAWEPPSHVYMKSHARRP